MANSFNMSRRRWLQFAGAAGVTALGAGLLSGCSSEGSGDSAKDSASKSLFEGSVYDPTGSIEITQVYAPRLDSLEGKTIAFISDDAWEDDRTFDLIKDLFAEKYPTTTILMQDNFPHGIDSITRENNGIPELLKEQNVDAAIVGNAG